MRCAITHGAWRIVAVDASHVVAEIIVSETMSIASVAIVVVVMMVMVVMWVIPVVVIPSPVMSIPIVWAIPVIIVVPGVVITVVGIIVEAEAEGIEAPVPRVAYINIGVAPGIVIVIIVHGGAGACAETLDTCRIVGIVVGFGGGVNHTVGVSHGFSGLVHWLRVGHVILTVGVISLIVISGATSARRDSAAIAANLRVAVVVRRVVGVVISRSPA